MNDYIWQRRIRHGVRNQKHAVPFPASVKVGLEFNAALERTEKLDPCLLTNGVMLELCDFARTVTRSEAYFLFEMLEFNFDLGVDADNHFQCYEYGRRVHSKIKLLKEQIKMKPRRWTETFALPDRTVVMAFAQPEQPGRYYPKRKQAVDSSVLSDGRKNGQSAEDRTSDGEAASGEFLIRKRGGVVLKLTDDSFPFCKRLGVTPIVRGEPTRKLEPHLATNGVMMELLDFSRLLCGTHTGMVHDLVRQNFGVKLDKMQFRMHVSRLTARNNACQTAEDKDAFRREPFKVHTEKQTHNQRKRPNPDAELQRLIMASKRRGTLRHRDDDAKEIWQEVDVSYMCPVDFETEAQSERQAEAEETKRDTKSTWCLDVKQEEEELSVSPVPLHADDGGGLSKLHPNVTPLKAESDPVVEDKKRDVSVKTLKRKLWTRRRGRCEQILKSSRANDPAFARCRQIGLDFDVASGVRQKLDLQLLTNSVLLEVHKFAVAMGKSLRSFLLDVLSRNFRLALHDAIQQNNFLVYILTKEKILRNNGQNQEAAFLSGPFLFPQVYSVTGDVRAGQDGETEQQTGTNWDQQVGPESHPFCKQLGINLWSTEPRPAAQKLDLNVLTRGAMFELLTFTRELCGAAHETVNDVLEHNFDLDLRSGETAAARAIQRWYASQKSVKRRSKTSSKTNAWLSMVVPVSDDSQLESTAERHLEDLKPNTPQLERRNSFDICRDVGVDLQVGRRSEDKTKLDLGLLTRGVLLEMHRYVVENSQRYVSALYDILQRNFDLRSRDHRKAEFAWSVASQVLAMAGKQRRNRNYLSRVFELPFEVSETSQTVCKDEPEDEFGEPQRDGEPDVVFVQELKPVDIEVEID